VALHQDLLLHPLPLQAIILTGTPAPHLGQMNATAVATADGAGLLMIQLSGIHQMPNADASIES